MKMTKVKKNSKSIPPHGAQPHHVLKLNVQRSQNHEVDFKLFKNTVSALVNTDSQHNAP